MDLESKSSLNHGGSVKCKSASIRKSQFEVVMRGVEGWAPCRTEFMRERDERLMHLPLSDEQ